MIVGEDIPPPNVDCDGYLVADDGALQTTTGPSSASTVPFRPNGNAPLVACAVLRFVTA